MRALAIILLLIAELNVCFADEVPVIVPTICPPQINEVRDTRDRKIKVTNGNCDQVKSSRISKKSRNSSQVATPTVVSIFSPVLNVGVVPVAPAVFAGMSSNAPRSVQPIPLKGEVKTTDKTSVSSTKADRTEFNFKIKDIINADIKSSCMPLIWCIFIAFAIFSGTVLWVAVKASRHGKFKQPFYVLIVFLAAAAFSFIFYLLAPKFIASSVAGKLQTQIAAIPASIGAGQTQGPIQFPYIQEQLPIIYDEKNSLSHKADVAPAERPLSKEKSKVSTAWLLFLGVAIVLLPLFKELFSFGNFAFSDDDTLPLDAIYRLEDLLGPFRVSTDHDYVYRDSFSKPNIDVDTFLTAINTVRRQLEGGIGMNQTLTTETMGSEFSYRFQDEKRYHYSCVHKALTELDNVLSARYGANLRSWRVKALKELANARSSILAVCEPVQNR